MANTISRFITISAVAFGLCATLSQTAQAQVGVSLSINQPGVYGRVNIGEPLPQYAYVYSAPTIYSQPAYSYQREPIYLYVPPAHSSNWGRYCGNYNACSQPVYFVQDRWVRERHANYQTQYQQQYRNNNGNRYGNGNGNGDRDRDGIRNRNDRDRDGDGVRNSQDRAPNNPNRR